MIVLVATPLEAVALPVPVTVPAPEAFANVTTVVLSIGSNMGDRLSALQSVVVGLDSVVRAVSPVYETAPVGGPAGQGPYLNAVVELDTQLFFKETYETRERLVERYGLSLIRPEIITVAEQHKREGDFRDHKQLARAIVTRRRVTLAFFQCLSQIRFSGLKCRSESKENAREQRRAERERQHAPVDTELVHAREAFGNVRRQHACAPDCEQ